VDEETVIDEEIVIDESDSLEDLNAEVLEEEDIDLGDLK